MKIIAIKFIVAIALSHVTLISNARPEDCDTAPKDSITKLPEPYSKWFNIECDVVLKGHFLVSSKNLKWTVNKTGKAFKFDAYGPIPKKVSILQRNIYEPHKHYFTGLNQAPINKKQLKGVNDLLKNKTKLYTNILQLDLKTNTNVLYSFFTYLNDIYPDWIVACVNYNCNKTVTIKVSGSA